MLSDANRDNVSASSKQDTPIDHPPHLEPLFWGTGDLLVWDVAKIMGTLDKERLFKTIWTRGTLDNGMCEGCCSEGLEPLFNELADLIIKDNLFDLRGLYGFFPVIGDGTELVVLDPSDFHSELFTVAFDRSVLTSGHAFCDYFRLEGDVMALGAVTIGSGVDKVIAGYLDAGDSDKRGCFLQGIALSVLESIGNRTAIEIRRSLGISDTFGKTLSMSGGSNLNPALGAVMEFAALEERLGIRMREDRKALLPRFSDVFCFIHHPAA